MSELDWPVDRGGAAVVRPDGVETAWRPGSAEHDEFAVASVTKLFTTMAALVAVEAGHLDLDRQLKIDRWAPDGDDQPTTSRHLLAHASGLPQETGRRRPQGTRRIYSNLGFRALAEAVEDAVGMAFPSWLESAVLRPLGLGATRLGPRFDVPDDPAAGIVSTTIDLVRLARCLLDRGAPLVSPALFAEATSVQFPGLAGLLPGVGRFDPLDWGLGFELRDHKRPHWMGDRRSAATFGHFGASGCFLWVDPEVPVAAVAVTDRPFDHDRWAMTTWPAWSDRLPAAG
jgi:CubicO group peptidase (beta-lactamase class C family)